MCIEIHRAGDDSAATKKAVLTALQESGVHLVKCSEPSAIRIRSALTLQLHRQWKRWQAGGRENLCDRRPGRCGRKPLAVLNEEEVLIAKRLYVLTNSRTTALRMLADSVECRQEVADAINKRRRSKHTLTKTMRAQIELPSAVLDYHKSPKKVRVNCFVNPRTLTYIDSLGTEKKLEPGDLFERDDMSNNFLCWVPWPWGGDKCSERYGVRVARGQNLLKIDVKSLFFTSFNFLVRLRDSYRADDLWAWIGQTYRDIGMPRIGERWERGTWAAKRLRGDKDVPIEAGHTPENVRLGGMAALGLRVIESHSPTTKIIESRFNFLQTVCGTIPGQIGRKRGEMERGQKIWTACRLGHRDPREYFLSFEQACDAIEQKLHYVNSEPVEGLLYHGVPAQIWGDGIGANPLKRLAPEAGFLFARDRREITVRKGNALVRYTTPEGQRAGWWFYHRELYRYDGLKCAVFFDHYAPAEGATIVIAEGKKTGTVLGQAELVQAAPQFALGFQTGEETGGADAMLAALERKGGFEDAVRSEYRALSIDGRRLARVATVDDGLGRQTRIGNAPALTTRPEPKRSRGDEIAAEARALHELARLAKDEAEMQTREGITPLR